MSQLEVYTADGELKTSSSGGGGSAPSTAAYITQIPDAGLSNEQAMSLLGTGVVKNTTATGVQSIAVPGTDYTTPAGAEALTNKTISSSTLIATALSLLLGGFKAIFTHANSADRTYTLPNYDGTLATRAGVETFTNKTLTSPVINTGVSGTAIDTDPTLAANSDTLLASQKATKSYVDAVATGLSPKQSARLASAAALPSNIYNNGASGVGATLTAVATGVLTVDGVAVALNDRILVKDEVAPANNGIYKCTLAGAVGVAYILTRSTDADTSTELIGAFVFIEAGTVNASAGFVCTNSTTITIGTTAISFTQFSGAGEITAGTGLQKSGNTLSIDSTVVTLAGSQTLTNKTLTSPAVNTPVISGGTADNIPIGGTTPASGIFSTLREKIGGFLAIFTHANSADRTYTLRDETGTLQMQRLTTKGDLLTYDTSDVRVGVGSDNQVLTADSAQAKGLKWALLSLVNSVTGILGVGNGGTGVANPTAHNLLVGNGSSAINTLAPGANRNVAVSDGTDWASRVLVAADLPNTAVTPASYTNTNLTVDAQGRITAASNGSSGSGQNQATCNGRLTLTTATPFTTADVLAATTLYFTPYAGNQIALYNGASWDLITFAEISIAVPATTSQMYDVFVYNSGGTATLELLAWTNDTTRATGLVLQDGVLCKSGALTRRYVGSMRTTTVSGQTEVSAKRIFVWNYYHRLPRFVKAVESTNTWSYTTATFRAANNATVVGTSRVEIIIGWAEVEVDVGIQVLTANATTSSVAVGIGIDSTSTNSALTFGGFSQATASPTVAKYKGYPAVGYHFIQWLEISQATGTTTWYGTNGLTYIQTGMIAEMAA